MPAFGNCSSGHRTGKGQFHSNPKERQCQKCSKYHTVALVSHTSKVTQNSPSYTSTVCELRTSRCSGWIYKIQKNQRSNCQHPLYHRKSKEIPEKNIYFCFTDSAKTFDCVDHSKLGNSSRDGNTRPSDLPLEKFVCKLGSNSYSWTWNNRLVSNRKRSTSRLYFVTLLV